MMSPNMATYTSTSSTSQPNTPMSMPPAKFKPGDKVCFTQRIEMSGVWFPPNTEFTIRYWNAVDFAIDDGVDENGNNKGAWSFMGAHKQYVEDAAIVMTKFKVDFETVVMPQEKKEQIKAAIAQLDCHKLIFEDWGFAEVFEKGTAVSLLFYGPPGTGKTLAAQAIADSLGLKLKLIQTAEIESSEPGQAERNIKAFFAGAVRAKQLLLFDECDSLINDRNEVGMILGAQINALLSALETYTGVVVFTTNRLGKMDPAMQRRISATVEFEPPNEAQRLEIWKRLIPKKAPLSKDVDLNMLAKFPIAGGNIKNAILSAARFAAYKKKPEIDEECFEHGIEKEVMTLKGFEAAYKQQNRIPHHRSGPPQDLGRDPGSISIKREKKPELEIDKIAEMDIVETEAAAA